MQFIYFLHQSQLGGVNMAYNSLDLRKKLSIEEYYRFSQRLAYEYATTSASTAVTALTEKYDVTKSAFYTLLEFAITHHLVSDKVVQSIREKLVSNLAAHGCKGYKSNVKYNQLTAKRDNFSAFQKKDIEYIAKYYAMHPEESKQEVTARFHFYSTKVLNRLLKRACMELIITDKIFNMLRQRAIDNAVDLDYTINFFCELARYRDKAKQIKKSQSAF